VKDDAKDVVARFTSGDIDRRSAVKALLGLGLTAPTAYIALGEMSAAHAQGSSANDPKLIARQSEAMAVLVTSSATVNKIKEISAAPNEAAKIRLARDYAETLKAQAAKTTELKGLRVTTRVFEPPKKPQDLPSTKVIAQSAVDARAAGQAPGDSDNITVCVSSGPGGALCVSVGVP
jgi:hypothetical protein